MWRAKNEAKKYKTGSFLFTF